MLIFGFDLTVDCQRLRRNYAGHIMSLAPLRSTLLALAALALLSGCAGYPPVKPFYRQFGLTLPFTKPAQPSPGEHAVGSGEARIVVRVGEQRAYFYRGREVVAETRISTGKSGFNTPAGNYRVTQKDRHHVSTTYGDFVNSSGAVVRSNVDVRRHAPAGARFRGARMPYFLRFHDGHGLHAGRVPNYPASHGCVRLPADMAKYFFENASIGTPVRVTH
jgi:lipoprotein-anchoring transpeptidase ErfK/SrfK